MGGLIRAAFSIYRKERTIMSFTVRFWTFSKKYNSTKRPANSNATTYNCVVKDGTGIINPKIVLDLGRTADPAAFNYCQIPNFNRYYFIREWSFDKGMWTASLECDVLASYKTEIGSSNLYILRAAGAYDGNIVDNLYPCKTGSDFVQESITAPYIVAGTYIVGCVSRNGDYGSIKYYALTTSEIRTLCAYLVSDVITDTANGFTISDASYALQNSIVDPVQYIKSCVFIPLSRADLVTTPVSQINVFDWDVPNLTTGHELNGNRVRKTFSVPITKHPDTLSRGNYVNAAPYTLLTLYFPPFGVLEIDTSVTCNASTLDLILDIDLLSGKGLLTVQCNGNVLNKVESMIGVPIQLSQVTRDYVGAVSSIASGISGAISGVLLGGPAGIAGAVGSAVGGIGNAIQSMAPRSQTIGSNGGFAALAGAAQLGHQFFRPVDDDLAHNGRPLCEKRTISTLSGYMLIQDGDVPINGTRTEGEQIRAYLEQGFYYE